jgi:hypothetical protein
MSLIIGIEPVKPRGFCSIRLEKLTRRESTNMIVPSSVTQANILVGITAHYNPPRIRYLTELLITLSQYQVNRIDVVVVTNTVVEAQLGVLTRLCQDTFPDGNATVQSYPNLLHPFDLGWMHKSLISDRLLSGDSDYSHFIYSEDDIRLTLICVNTV